MTRALLATTALLVLAVVLVGCNGSDTSSADRAAHDKGPRPVAATPEPAPGSNLQIGSRGGDSSTGHPPAGGNTGGSTGH